MTDTLSNAIAELRANLIRVHVDLAPASQTGLVYPPTYDQGNHIFRPAWVDGQAREAVLLDSVQSQSNRVEEAILMAHRRSDIQYPDIEVDIDAATGKEAYSILQLSHRVYDAALRATLMGDGTPFPKSAVGKDIYAARSDSATALFHHAPITLVLGGWDSHGGGGPLVAKLPRLLSSEIVGLDAKPVRRGAVKFDPMDIRKAAGPVYKAEDADLVWTTEKGEAVKKAKDMKPSEIGLGNVPAMEDRGAVISGALQTSALSLTATRRLRFPDEDGRLDESRDEAGRLAVVALGLYGLLSQMEMGYNLRSGCDLIPTGAPSVEVLGASLVYKREVAIDAEQARTWLQECLDRARSHGLTWRPEPIRVTADDKLKILIERSRLARDTGD